MLPGPSSQQHDSRKPVHRRRTVDLKQAYVWSPPAGWDQVGPGVWHPPGYQPTRWELAQPRIRSRAESKIDWIKCKKSLAYFAFAHCWTLDADDPSGDSIRKFPAYPYLRAFYEAVQVPTNTHVEKSRQMLLSWAWMVVFVYDVTFNRNWAGQVLSKRSIDVDDGGADSTPNSNLGKFRFIQSHLPEHLWLPVEYKKFSIRVPSTRSSVRGETGKGGMAARGPTYNRALMDEAAYVEHSETVFTGMRQAAKRGTCLNSTPNGAGNTFYRIRFSKTTTFKKLSFHWSQHPRKAIGLYCLCGWKATPGTGFTPRQQFEQHAGACPRLTMVPPRSPEMRAPWYDREAADMTPEKVASDLDISYSASRRGRCYTAFDQMRNILPVFHAIGPRWLDETELDYRFRYLRSVIDPVLQCFTTWDIGVGDPCSLLFGQIVNDSTPYVRILDEFEDADQSYDYYARVVNTVWKPAAVECGNNIAFHHYGGHDVTKRESDLESWWSNLRREGITIEREFKGSLLEWVDYINDQFRNANIEISEWCTHFIDVINNYHYPLDDTGVPIPGEHLPVHDEWSHAADALRHLYRVRFTPKLLNRKGKGVTTKRMLSRGGGFNLRDETRKF